MKLTDTNTLISACRILARDIHSDDGVANAALVEIADRIEELENNRIKLKGIIVKIAIHASDALEASSK